MLSSRHHALLPARHAPARPDPRPPPPSAPPPAPHRGERGHHRHPPPTQRLGPGPRTGPPRGGPHPHPPPRPRHPPRPHTPRPLFPQRPLTGGPAHALRLLLRPHRPPRLPPDRLPRWPPRYPLLPPLPPLLRYRPPRSRIHRPRHRPAIPRPLRTPRCHQTPPPRLRRQPFSSTFDAMRRLPPSSNSREEKGRDSDRGPGQTHPPASPWHDS